MGRLRIKARHAPQPTEQGPIIAAADAVAIDELFGGHAGLQHPAPAAQLFCRQFGLGRWCQLGNAIAIQAGPQAGQAAHQHLLHLHRLLGGDQFVARFMDGDAAQSGLATGQGLRQHMAPPPPIAGRIEAEAPQGQGREQGDPPGG